MPTMPSTTISSSRVRPRERPGKARRDRKRSVEWAMTQTPVPARKQPSLGGNPWSMTGLLTNAVRGCDSGRGEESQGIAGSDGASFRSVIGKSLLAVGIDGAFLITHPECLEHRRRLAPL